jgi:hypothetical protein
LKGNELTLQKSEQAALEGKRGEEKTSTCWQDLLEDGTTKVREQRSTKCIPVVLPKVERPVLVSSCVGHVESGLFQKRKGSQRRRAIPDTRESGTHPDEVDDKAVEEPKEEVAQHLPPLPQVERVRLLLLVLLVRSRGRGKPSTIKDGESLKKSVNGRRLPAAQTDEGRDV